MPSIINSDIMQDNKVTGYAFVVLGVIVLLFDAYLAYTFYGADVSHAYTVAGQQSVPSSLPPGILGIFFTNSMQSFLYLLIAVFILLVIASIGSRLVGYGMSFLNLYKGGTEAEASEEAEARKEVARAKF